MMPPTFPLTPPVGQSYWMNCHKFGLPVDSEAAGTFVFNRVRVHVMRTASRTPVFPGNVSCARPWKLTVRVSEMEGQQQFSTAGSFRETFGTCPVDKPSMMSLLFSAVMSTTMNVSMVSV